MRVGRRGGLGVGFVGFEVGVRCREGGGLGDDGESFWVDILEEGERRVKGLGVEFRVRSRGISGGF